MLGEGDYSGKHSAPSRDAAPLHDLTREVPGGGQVFPNDVYTHMRYYQFHEVALERQAERVIRAARGKPNAMVTIYRALPAGMTKINPGDWVTIVKDYAMSHAAKSGPNGEDWPVIAAKVKAKDLHTNGDSLMEWGYNGAGSVSASVVETRMKPRGVLLFEAGYDVTAGPKERARREKAERERQAHHAALKAKYGDDPNASAQDARARAAAKRAARRVAKKPVQEADVDIRHLERLAALGDAQAATKLRRARVRAHLVSVSVSGLQGAKDRARVQGGPLRAPHYTASERAVVDELKMAQGGVLYLDELEGFPKRVIEMLVHSLPGADVELVVSPRPRDQKYAAPRWDKHMMLLRSVRESIEEADVDIRELERQAAQGDTDAKRALLRARQRTGYAVYGYTQSGKPMRADSSLAGSRSQRVVVSPWLAQSVSGWSVQDIADAYALTKLYSKKRAKDKRWGTYGSPDRFAPETLGFTKQSSALGNLLRQHPDVVAASAEFDRYGYPGSGIGHVAVEYTDKGKNYYKNFFRKDPGKKLYMQSYFGGEMTEAAAPSMLDPDKVRR